MLNTTSSLQHKDAPHWMALFASVSIAIFVASACARLPQGRQIEAFGRIATLAGDVENSEQHTTQTLVVVHRLRDLEPRLADYQVLPKPGSFSFRQPPGRYVVTAFQDSNRDFAYQPGEPIGQAGITSALLIKPDTPPPPVRISMSADFALRGTLDLDLSHRRTDENLAAHRRNVGVLASLDDPRFSSESGSTAAHDPMVAFETGSFGLFFVEAYDPTRIPVLFIHGLNGSPQDLRPLIEQLDRTKFQPWFFAYPSFLRLPALSRILRDAVVDVEATYSLTHLYVVAHSMGGLLSLDLARVPSTEAGAPLVPTLVTLATPFGGHASASGIKRIPSALKPRWLDHISWIDMVPDSQFLRNLYRTPLPEELEHHLFFAFLPDLPHDGFVSLESQLAPQVEGPATLYGEQIGHVDILTSPRVATRLRGIFGEAYDRDRNALRPGPIRMNQVYRLAEANRFSVRLSDLAGESDLRADEFERRILARIGPIDELLLSQVVTRAVQRANKDAALRDAHVVLERDQRWRDGEYEAVASEATDIDCNRALAQFVGNTANVTEIIVTTQHGVNACQSGATTDYLQADEAWWSRTANDPRVWNDPLSLDESTNQFAISIYVPLFGVRIPSGEDPIGFAKVIFTSNDVSAEGRPEAD